MNIIEIILEIKVKFKKKLHKIITFKKQMGKTNSMWINEKKKPEYESKPYTSRTNKECPN